MSRFVLLLLFTLAAGPAAAQSIFFWTPRMGEPLPLTKQIIQDGKVVGTATMSGNTTVFRDARGQLVGSAVIANGVQTNYDPSGKVISTGKIEGGAATIRDAEGNITAAYPLKP